MVLPVSETGIIPYIILAVTCAVSLSVMKKTGHFMKSLFLSVFSGAGSLIAVNLLSTVTGVKIGYNILTVLFCIINGAWGSVCLIILGLARIL